MHLKNSLLSLTKDFFLKVLLFFRKETYDAKVFCIGFNKTGTTSLGKSLEVLGYKNASFNHAIWKEYKRNNLIKIIRYTAKFDSTDDLPWLREDLIPLLDRFFPGSKFIYLTRDEDSWKRSFKNWRFKVFGEYPDVEKGWSSYKKHEHFVRSYFRNFPKERFLELKINDENGFAKLAVFLNKRTNLKNFPVFNSTKKQELSKETFDE